MLQTVKLIGQGSEKLCYALDNGQVALVSTRRVAALRSEQKELEVLREAGLPVFETTLQRVWLHETESTEQALVGRRYDGHFLVYDSLRRNEVRPDILMRAAEILRQMIECKVFASDPQFLFDMDGTVVLCDPGTVRSPRGRALLEANRRFYRSIISSLKECQ